MEETNISQEQNPLGAAPVGGLILKFAIPAIISMLVSAMYNIVDQIFIGQGVGMLGNAATNVAFPVTTIATALALLLGIGGASNYNLEMGAGREKKASSIAGTALSTLVITGVILAVAVLLFLRPLLSLFGATTDVMPYAVDYLGITAVGLPFYALSIGGNHIVRADRSPTYSMTCSYRCHYQHNFGSPFHLWVWLGNQGCCLGNGDRTGCFRNFGGYLLWKIS